MSTFSTDLDLARVSRKLCAFFSDLLKLLILFSIGSWSIFICINLLECWNATWGTAFWRRGESWGTGVRVTAGEGGGVGGAGSSRGGGGGKSSAGGDAGEAGDGLLASSLLVFLVRKLIFLSTPRKDFFFDFSSSFALRSTCTFWASNWLLSWKFKNEREKISKWEREILKMRKRKFLNKKDKISKWEKCSFKMRKRQRNKPESVSAVSVSDLLNCFWKWKS